MLVFQGMLSKSVGFGLHILRPLLTRSYQGTQIGAFDVGTVFELFSVVDDTVGNFELVSLI
jgi:hypothetical protein